MGWDFLATEAKIRDCLRAFATAPLRRGALNLLAALDIRSDRTMPVGGTADEFLNSVPASRKPLTDRER